MYTKNLLKSLLIGNYYVQCVKNNNIIPLPIYNITCQLTQTYLNTMLLRKNALYAACEHYLV